MAPTKTTVTLTAAAILAMTTALGTAQDAFAGPVTHFGVEQRLHGPAGTIGYTVTNLKASDDRIPAQVNGHLWQATATVEAVRGSVTPLVPQFHARAADGHDYPALFQAATPQGLNPRSLDQGEKSTGTVYFDVVAQRPDSVVIDDGGSDLAIWKQ